VPRARAGTAAGMVPPYDGAMISIAMLGGGRDAAAYYLDRGAGCEADYYLEPEESAGWWCGHGVEALGLMGDLDAAGQETN
jgi:TrwC relaxase